MVVLFFVVFLCFCFSLFIIMVVIKVVIVVDIVIVINITVINIIIVNINIVNITIVTVVICTSKHWWCSVGCGPVSLRGEGKFILRSTVITHLSVCFLFCFVFASFCLAGG